MNISTDFQDTSIFQDIIQFTANGQEYRVEEKGNIFKVYKLSGDSFIFYTSLKIKGKVTPKKIYIKMNEGK
jgi:hypothetical protein